MSISFLEADVVSLASLPIVTGIVRRKTSSVSSQNKTMSQFMTISFHIT